MNKKAYIKIFAGFCVGILWFGAVRFALIQDKTVHYHANFGLYINGKQDKFDNFTQYEEVQACSGNTTSNPRGRAHLHKPSPHVIHVHDNAVTWNAFFANVGYGLSDKAITTNDGVFVDGQNDKHLTFILNGKKVDTVSNRIIENTDALLVSYGDELDSKILEQFTGIPKDAEIVNTQFDPASCSGTKTMGFNERLRASFNFSK
ncbi:MAG: hypothetical protein WCJ60_02850 [bacterium]